MEPYRKFGEFDGKPDKSKKRKQFTPSLGRDDKERRQTKRFNQKDFKKIKLRGDQWEDLIQ